MYNRYRDSTCQETLAQMLPVRATVQERPPLEKVLFGGMPHGRVLDPQAQESRGRMTHPCWLSFIAGAIALLLLSFFGLLGFAVWESRSWPGFSRRKRGNGR
jgi:hypothetical protein